MELFKLHNDEEIGAAYQEGVWFISSNG